MSKQIIIAEQHRIAAVFSEDQIQELIVASGDHQVGDVYLGIVENVLPSIDAAFVNIGNPDRNGFIHVSDLGPLRLKRNSAAITELVAPQQKVVVQVMKEPTGNKGPRLTGNLSFPGRYLVMMPSQRGVHLSRRIRSEEERNRLKSLAILIKPPHSGLLVRTEAEGVSEEAILDDLDQLKKQWEQIQQQQTTVRAPSLLNRDDDFIQRVLRDVYSSDVNRIVTDSPNSIKRVRQYLQSWNQGQMPPGVVVDAYRDSNRTILDFFRVNAAIRQALRPRVDLPSGGYIVIEPTEALTVVDVNSGSFTQSATSRETVLWTNCEAATEIARQLRLRNIAGVIVVDFIDMESRRDQLQVLEHFNKALRTDKARPQVAQLSELGLVELTRKRQGQSLYEIFGRSCPTCEGLGLLAHLPGVHADQESSGLDLGDDLVANGGDGSDGRPTPVSPGFSGRGRNGNRSQLRPRGSGRMILDGSLRSNAPEEISPTPDATTPRLDPLSMGSAPPSRDKVLLRDRSEGRGKINLINKGREESESGSREPGSRDSGLRDSGLRGNAPFSKGTKRIPERRVVQVEMTPLQQQIYAEMGLSPALLLEEKVEVGTLITVTLPGESAGIPNPGFNTGADQGSDSVTDFETNHLPDPVSHVVVPPVEDLEQALPYDSETDRPSLAQEFGGDISPDISGSTAEDQESGSECGTVINPSEVSLAPEKQSPPASRRRRRST